MLSWESEPELTGFQKHEAGADKVSKTWRRSWQGFKNMEPEPSKKRIEGSAPQNLFNPHFYSREDGFSLRKTKCQYYILLYVIFSGWCRPWTLLTISELRYTVYSSSSLNIKGTVAGDLPTFFGNTNLSGPMCHVSFWTWLKYFAVIFV